MTRPTIDARALSRDELLRSRLEVVHLHTSGVPVMQIVKETGLGWATVNRAIQLFNEGGESSLAPSPRGRGAGSGLQLTAGQQHAVRDLIRRRVPSYYGLKDALWSRDAVRHLVAGRLSIDISVRTMGNYLSEWGLALPTASEGPAGRCAPAVRSWLQEHYAGLTVRAKAEEAVICWANKPRKLDGELWSAGSATALVEAADGVGGVGGAATSDIALANGATPAASTKRLMVSASNNQGKLRWLVISAPFNADRQIAFVKALAKDASRRPVFLIRHELKSYAHPDVAASIDRVGLRVELFP